MIFSYRLDYVRTYGYNSFQEYRTWSVNHNGETNTMNASATYYQVSITELGRTIDATALKTMLMSATMECVKLARAARRAAPLLTRMGSKDTKRFGWAW